MTEMILMTNACFKLAAIGRLANIGSRICISMFNQSLDYVFATLTLTFESKVFERLLEYHTDHFYHV